MKTTVIPSRCCATRRVIRSLYLLFTLSFFSTNLSAQQWAWVKNDFAENTYYKSKIVYASDYIYVSFDSTIVKYNTYGNIVWTKSIGNIFILDINCTNNAIYVTGYFKNTADFGITSFTSQGLKDIFIAKFDQNGICQWAASAGDTGDDISNSIIVDLAGNIFITGQFFNSITFDSFTLTATNTYRAFFLFKFNDSGHTLWAKQSINSVSYGKQVKTDSLNNVYILTSSGHSVTFDGITVYGDMEAGNMDVLLKYSSTGSIVWAKLLGQSLYTSMGVMSTDKSINIYISRDGRYYSSTILKYDIDGNLIWSKQVGEASYSLSVRSMHLSETGNLFISGYFSFDGTFCSTTYPGGLYIVKWDSDGNCYWPVNAIASRGIAGESIYTNQAGDIYLAGIFSDTANIGNATFNTSNTYNLFVAKLRDNITSTEENVSSEDLNLYPNPSHNIFNISGSIDEPLNIKIYSASGSLIYFDTLYNLNSSITHQISLEATPGVYYLRAEEKKESFVKKLVVY
jgi:hypothetical protein